MKQPEVISEEQVQLLSRIWPVRRSSSAENQIEIVVNQNFPPVTPQDFWPEFDPFVEGALPMSDFLSQHLPMLGLCVQKWHSASRRQAAAYSSWVSAPSGNRLWPEYFVPSSTLQARMTGKAGGTVHL